MRIVLVLVLALALVLVLGCADRRGAGFAGAPPAVARDGYCRGGGAYSVVHPELFAGDAAAPGAKTSMLRPVNTYSIVARDPATGELGVAVQSHWFSVGSLVTWAEAGVGAVATQSFVEPAYGPRALALLRDGMDAPAALAKLVAEDPQPAVRQVAVIDAHGKVDAFTGDRCIQFAGDHVGAGYSVQANLMANDRVVPAMAAAFEKTGGDLAHRLLAALDAGQAAGGDIRGCQSAALLVVSGTRSDKPWAEKRFDLRVEDSPAPLVELRRLVTLARAYEHMNKGDLAVEKNDIAGAVEHYGAAAGMVPGSAEMVFWAAIALATHGDVEKSLPMFRRAFADDPAWAELVTRLPAAGLIPDTPEGQALVKRILSEATRR
jgi:uncharacterized Ntn-hydrolase superfamily protein